MKKTIVIAEYNQRWPIIYSREEEKILTAVSDKILAIEHIGSTAVPGLAAKPIIDIMIAIESFVLIDELVKLLDNIGYKHVPEHEMTLPVPDRRFFDRGPSNLPNRHFHLHVAEKESEFCLTNILFRDYLRNHQNIAQKYVDLKKRLAITCNGNSSNYCGGKSSFIKGIIHLAKKEQLENLKSHKKH